MRCAAHAVHAACVLCSLYVLAAVLHACAVCMCVRLLPAYQSSCSLLMLRLQSWLRFQFSHKCCAKSALYKHTFPLPANKHYTWSLSCVFLHHLWWRKAPGKLRM